MEHRSFFIGLSGFAGCGKDLFSDLLGEELESRDISSSKVSIAESLKVECRSSLVRLTGIDILNCTREEKNKVRDYLVFYGLVMRDRSGGRHWIDRTSERINRWDSIFPREPVATLEYIPEICEADMEGLEEESEEWDGGFPHVFCITDIRYDEYKKDEVYWVKKELKGKLVHLTKEGSPAANSFEEENDPRLQEKADYKIVWPDCNSNQKEINKHLRPRVLQFIDWLLENEKKKKI